MFCTRSVIRPNPIAGSSEQGSFARSHVFGSRLVDQQLGFPPMLLHKLVKAAWIVIKTLPGFLGGAGFADSTLFFGVILDVSVSISKTYPGELVRCLVGLSHLYVYFHSVDVS